MYYIARSCTDALTLWKSFKGCNPGEARFVRILAQGRVSLDGVISYIINHTNNYIDRPVDTERWGDKLIFKSDNLEEVETMVVLLAL